MSLAQCVFDISRKMARWEGVQENDDLFMNKKQKTAILIGTLLILLMALFPPWETQPGGANGPSLQLGYEFILDPPIPGFINENIRFESLYIYSTINMSQLIMQWAGVVLVVIGLVLILKDKQQNE